MEYESSKGLSTSRLYVPSFQSEQEMEFWFDVLVIAAKSLHLYIEPIQGGAEKLIMSQGSYAGAWDTHKVSC